MGTRISDWDWAWENDYDCMSYEEHSSKLSRGKRIIAGGATMLALSSLVLIMNAFVVL